MKKLIIATRGSALALAQANMIREQLASMQVESELFIVTTKGDKDRTTPLTQIGGGGLFVRGIEEALLQGEADIAVHCGKDLPYALMEGLTIAGIPQAAASGDMLIWTKDGLFADYFRRNTQQDRIAQHLSAARSSENKNTADTSGTSFDSLAGGTKASRSDCFAPVIGTGSPRRVIAANRLFPHAEFRNIRGNIATRLGKIKSGDCDAVILAKAGIDRQKLDLSGYETHLFTPEEMLPACCQGILALECRKSDLEIREILEKLTDPETALRFHAERTLFRALKADCAMPVGVHAVLQGQEITLHAMMNGRQVSRTGSRDRLPEITRELAEILTRI